MKTNPPTPLRGSFPPVVTPFRGGNVDFDEFASLIEFQIEQGSHGVLVNGTTAEPSTLTVEERNRTVRIAVEVANGRVPVVAATGSQSLAETRTLSHFAQRTGADVLLIVTPYYIRPPQRGLTRYYAELAKDLTTPWMIYHIPGRAGVDVSIETLREIRSECPGLIGIKHATTDLSLVSDCLQEFGPDFRVFVGLEELSLPMMAVGACGLMNAVGNLAPGRVAALADAMLDNDLLKARALHYELLKLNRAVFFDTNPIPIKYMMKRLGLLNDNEHRLPMTPPTPDLMLRLDSLLKETGLLERTDS